MDKKRFLKISDTVLKEYGFIKRGSLYLLNLNDMIVGIRNRTCREVNSWDYWIGIHALHSVDVPLEKRYNTSVEIHLEHNNDLQGYHKYEILYEQLSEEQYIDMFKQMLHKEFDGYKVNGIIQLKQKDIYFYLRPNARKFVENV